MGSFFGSGKEGRSWCYSGQNSLAMVGYRGKSLQLYVGYSLEGNYYLRGFGRRLSASRRGLGEFQLRLSFVEEAWLPQSTCRGACRFDVPADRQSWDRSIPWRGWYLSRSTGSDYGATIQRQFEL